MLEKMKNINFYLYQILFKSVYIPVLSYYRIYADTECHLFRPKRAYGAKQKGIRGQAEGHPGYVLSAQSKKGPAASLRRDLVTIRELTKTKCS